MKQRPETAFHKLSHTEKLLLIETQRMETNSHKGQRLQTTFQEKVYASCFSLY